MRVFLTGGTGFIGQHVINNFIKNDFNIALLVEKDEINKIENTKNIQIITGDLSEINKWEDKVREFCPEICVHLAWEGIPDYSYKNSLKNLKMSLNLFNLLSEIECRKILCSGSCWEYNKTFGKLDESICINPINSFTSAKHATHIMGNQIAKESGMDFIWTRFFYVYGPGQKNHSLIPHIINSIKSGNNLDIKTPHSKNDFVYVKDVAEALSMIASKAKGIETYNIGSGYSTQIKDIIELVFRASNMKKIYKSNDTNSSESEKIDFYADIEKIQKKIGWKPKTSIAEGVNKTYKSMVHSNGR